MSTANTDPAEPSVVNDVVWLGKLVAYLFFVVAMAVPAVLILLLFLVVVVTFLT